MLLFICFVPVYVSCVLWMIGECVVLYCVALCCLVVFYLYYVSLVSCVIVFVVFGVASF